jgi:hypothetical protein
MPDNDGLPLPPPPQPPPPSIARAQDIAPGSVNNSISSALQSANGSLGPFTAAVNASAAQSGGPQFPQFTPDPGGGILRPTQSLFEQSVGSDESLLGAFKAVGGSIASAARPVAGITDEVQVAEIQAMQQQFLANHGKTLENLAGDQNSAQAAMRNLSKFMKDPSNFGVGTSPLRGLMAQKSQVGDDVAAQIADALDQTTDPDQRAQLQAMQNDMQNWMQDRDSRVASEQNEVNALTDRFNNLQSVTQQQIGSMDGAGRIVGPRNEYTNGQLTGSTYADLGALNFMQSMQNFLVGSRGQVSRALGGS